MKTFKAQLRIPTEMYAYIEVSVEGTAEDILDAYKEFNEIIKPKAGLSQKDFNACLDRYLNDGTGETEVYLAMSPSQQAVIQEIKKAFKRIEAREGKLQVETD